MVVWETALYDKLEPLTHFGENQIATSTPGQLVTMIRFDGAVVTAVHLFFGILVLLLFLSTKKLASSAQFPKVLSLPPNR
ncbi:MAG: hypothetical protein WCF90_06440 [Methanomicrobiales archaeon]